MPGRKLHPKQLLGRERELAVLHRVVFDRQGRAGSVLLLIGEPGIGKSALLDQVRAEATAAGFRVLSAAGAEGEMHLPFGGLHQILCPLMSLVDALPRRLGQALRTALGVSDGPRPDLFLIAEAAQQLVCLAGAQRPVVVLADDLQWLDPQSHQVVTFLAHRSGVTRASVLGAARIGHDGLFMQTGFPVLSVDGVDEAAAEMILNRQTRTLSTAERIGIRLQAQGNPLALLELPAAWGRCPNSVDQPPTLSARLERAFAGRIAELPDITRDALLLAATDSSGNLAEALAATSAFNGEVCHVDVFNPAQAAGLLSAADGLLRFRHPLVRSGVLQRETVVRRQDAHRALAEVLPVGELFRRAWHRAQSITGPDDPIADALEATVDDSLRRGAVLSAVSSLERAAQLTGSSARRGQRLVRAAGHAFEAGRPVVVGRLVREACSADLGELDRARVLWLDEVRNDDARGNSSLVVQLCVAAGNSATAGDVGLGLNLLLAAALRCWWADCGLAAQAAVLRGLDRLADAKDDPRHLAAMAIAEPVLRGAEVLHRLASAALEGNTDGDVLRTVGMAAYAVGDFPLAAELLDRAGRRFREEGRLGLLPVVLALQLHIRLDLGDWSGAAWAAEEVQRISVETGQALFAANNVLVESRGIALRGDWQSALDLVTDAEADAVRQQINDRVCLAYQTRGIALLSAGRPDEAFACLARTFDPTDAGYHLRESFGGLGLLAEASVECGRGADAQVIVSAMEAVAALTPSPLLAANLRYARAMLAETQDAEALYLAALAELRCWPWLQARTLLGYGRWLFSAGRLSAAGEYLRSAGDMFDSMGAVGWSRRSRAALLRITAARRAGPGGGG